MISSHDNQNATPGSRNGAFPPVACVACVFEHDCQVGDIHGPAGSITLNWFKQKRQTCIKDTVPNTIISWSVSLNQISRQETEKVCPQSDADTPRKPSSRRRCAKPDKALAKPHLHLPLQWIWLPHMPRSPEVSLGNQKTESTTVWAIHMKWSNSPETSWPKWCIQDHERKPQW